METLGYSLEYEVSPGLNAGGGRAAAASLNQSRGL